MQTRFLSEHGALRGLSFLCTFRHQGVETINTGHRGTIRQNFAAPFASAAIFAATSSWPTKASD